MRKKVRAPKRKKGTRVSFRQRVTRTLGLVHSVISSGTKRGALLTVKVGLQAEQKRTRKFKTGYAGGLYRLQGKKRSHLLTVRHITV